MLITFNLLVTSKHGKAKSLHKIRLQIWPQEQPPKECFSEYRSSTWPSDSQSDTSANIRNVLDTLQLLPCPRDVLQQSLDPRYYLHYGGRSLHNRRIICRSNDNSDMHLQLTVARESKGPSLMSQPTRCWPHPAHPSWAGHFTLYIPFLCLTRRLDSQPRSTQGIPLTAVAVVVPVVSHGTRALPLERAVPRVHFSQGLP